MRSSTRRRLSRASQPQPARVPGSSSWSAPYGLHDVLLCHQDAGRGAQLVGSFEFPFGRDAGFHGRDAARAHHQSDRDPPLRYADPVGVDRPRRRRKHGDPCQRGLLRHLPQELPHADRGGPCRSNADDLGAHQSAGCSGADDHYRLDRRHPYYFVVRAKDEVPNVAGLSNCAAGTTDPQVGAGVARTIWSSARFRRPGALLMMSLWSFTIPPPRPSPLRDGRFNTAVPAGALEHPTEYRQRQRGLSRLFLDRTQRL